MSKTEADILNYLKTLDFKPAVLGVSKQDVLEKIRVLNNMYRELVKEKQTPPEKKDEYDEKVDAVAKAFIRMQEQSDGILAQARLEAEEIVTAAKMEADQYREDKQHEIFVEEARIRDILRTRETESRRELEQLELQKTAIRKYLEDAKKRLHLLLDDNLLSSQEDFSYNSTDSTLSKDWVEEESEQEDE